MKIRNGPKPFLIFYVGDLGGIGVEPSKSTRYRYEYEGMYWGEWANGMA
jgi:hypothetical protein